MTKIRLIPSSYIVLIVAGLWVIPAFPQQMYKWKDERGQWHFSDSAPKNTNGVEKITPKDNTSVGGSMPYEQANDGAIPGDFEAEPTPNVRILWSRLEGSASRWETYFAGQVVNNGNTVANYVKVSFEIRNSYGTVVASATADVNPSHIAPGAQGFFRERVGLADTRGYSWSSKIEWPR